MYSTGIGVNASQAKVNINVCVDNEATFYVVQIMYGSINSLVSTVCSTGL